LGAVFYVYEHWRPDTGACFYVGKGSGRRAYDMRRGRNRHHKFIQEKLAGLGMAVEVRLVAERLLEGDALALEIERIASHRKAGVALANVSAGGEGPSGRRHTEDEKRRVSAKLKGRVVSASTRAKLSAAAMGNKNGLGMKKSPEAIERTAAAHRGATRSPESRAKISASQRARYERLREMVA
jgi:hypothetical protein